MERYFAKVLSGSTNPGIKAGRYFNNKKLAKKWCKTIADLFRDRDLTIYILDRYKDGLDSYIYEVFSHPNYNEPKEYKEVIKVNKLK